jgi:hypothetical protein
MAFRVCLLFLRYHSCCHTFYYKVGDSTKRPVLDTTISPYHQGKLHRIIKAFHKETSSLESILFKYLVAFIRMFIGHFDRVL